MELHMSQKEVLPFYYEIVLGCIHIQWSGQDDQSAPALNIKIEQSELDNLTCQSSKREKIVLIKSRNS